MYESIPNVNEMVGVEVGCYSGESSEIAAQFLKKLYCIDIWSRVFFGLDDPAEEGPEEVFDRRMGRFDNVVKIKARSLDIGEIIEPGSIDLVYIDGLHEFDDVCKDIQMWHGAVRHDGYVCGHDYTDNPQHEGVKLAVDHYYPACTVFSDGSWLFRKG